MSNRWQGGFIQAYFDPLTVGPATPALYTWGQNNSSGSLGQDDININRSSPVQVTSSVWTSVAGGQVFSTGIKSDGTLWAWGANNAGQLGKGDVIPRSSPTQVGALTTWTKVGNGSTHAFAVKTDGTLWTWGSNTNGRLGTGDRVNVSSPVQIGALTDWVEAAGLDNASVALKTDGTLWTWGDDGNGRLGQNTVNVDRSSPTQVGALTNWRSISPAYAAVIATKTDNTIWSWGTSIQGILGQASSSVSSPTQIGALTNWNTILKSFGYSIGAVKTDGTLWVWGKNSSGQLGLGDAVARSSPVQVGSLNTWLTGSATYGNASAFIKTDGTLWTTGNNNNGLLGQDLPTTVLISSPTQVGTDTNWYDAPRCGAGWFLATKDI